MNIQTKPIAAIRHEAMRIAGKRVETDHTIEVLNPYTGAVVGIRRQFRHQRDVRQDRVLGRRELHDVADLAVADPFRIHAHHAGP